MNGIFNCRSLIFTYKVFQYFFFILLFLFTVSCESKVEVEVEVEETSTEPKCSLSTSKLRYLVRRNWRNIQKTASFTVSNKASFEVEDYSLDGGDLIVDIFSRGFIYDISFSVSFDAGFNENCGLEGYVLDVYNYTKY